ncbi:MAG: DUF2911 domain-containing protein [Balneolaceae bacterium]
MPMKRLFSFSTFLIAGLVLVLFSESGWAQERGGDSPRISPNAAVSQTIGTTEVHLTYGRPGVRDRDIFGELVPYGNVWRAGANESTYISFSDDVLIEGEPLDAGEYSLYTVPGINEWTVIINSSHSWGTEYDPSADALRIQVEPEEGPFTEQMMFYFENVSNNSADLVLQWEETKVPVTISIP